MVNVPVSSMSVPLTVILLIIAVQLGDVWGQTGSTGTNNDGVCQAISCSDDCGSDGHCVELDDCSTACVCNDGFEGNPPNCTEIDCLLNRCGMNAICASDTGGNPICECADGYVGSGAMCAPARCSGQCGHNEHSRKNICSCVCNDGFRNSTKTCGSNGTFPATTPTVSNGQPSSTSVNPSSTAGVSGRNGLLSSTTPAASNGQPSLASVNPSYTEGVPGGKPTVEYRPSVSGTSSGDVAADFPVIAIIVASVGCGVLVLCLICALICCATRTRKQSTKKVQSPYRMPEENRARLDEESVYNPSYQSVEHDVTTRDDMTKPNPTDPASFSKSVVIKSINPDDRDTHETAFPVTLPRIVHTTSHQKIDSSGANEATAKNGDNTTTPGGQKDPIRTTSHQSSASKSHGGRPDANGRTGNEPNSDTGPTEDRYSIVSKSDSQFDGSTDGSSIVDRQAAPYAMIEHTQRPIVDEEYSQPKMARSENKMAGNDDRMARNGRMAGSGDKLAGNVVNDDATYDTPDGELITDRGPLAQSPQRIGKDYPYAAIQKKSRRGKQAGDAEAGHVFSMGGDDLKSTGNTSGPDYEGGVYNVAYDSCDLKTTPEDDGDALTYYYVDEGKDKKHDGNKDRRTSSGLYESF